MLMRLLLDRMPIAIAMPIVVLTGYSFVIR
jgi:hypothetical protein